MTSLINSPSTDYRSHSKHDFVELKPQHVDSDDQEQHHQRRIVCGKQAYILGASINTGRVFPYQFDMVNNYLEEASRRFESERQSKAKLRQEQIELEEKRQREIYLNGGFVDCVNSGCQGQVISTFY